MQALSSAHNHSCPPSAWQPLSSPGLRESGKNSQGRGTGGPILRSQICFLHGDGWGKGEGGWAIQTKEYYTAIKKEENILWKKTK